MKRILLTLAVVAGALLGVAIGAFLLALIATGIGALLSSFLPFAAFEATLLALIAVIGVAIVAGQIVGAILRIPSLPTGADVDEDEEEDDWESGEWEDDLDEWEEDEEDIIDPADFAPSKPRWQQPIRRTEFETVGRNDPCPCGSGRKYKNCHGQAQAAN